MKIPAASHLLHPFLLVNVCSFFFFVQLYKQEKTIMKTKQGARMHFDQECKEKNGNKTVYKVFNLQ